MFLPPDFRAAFPPRFNLSDFTLSSDKTRQTLRQIRFLLIDEGFFRVFRAGNFSLNVGRREFARNDLFEQIKGFTFRLNAQLFLQNAPADFKLFDGLPRISAERELTHQIAPRRFIEFVRRDYFSRRVRTALKLFLAFIKPDEFSQQSPADRPHIERARIRKVTRRPLRARRRRFFQIPKRQLTIRSAKLS